ncbi:MAG: inorganic phosphate transporter [Desulfurococcaceae archaeon]
MDSLLIYLGLTLAAMYAFVIGANDMANVIGVAVGGGILGYRNAVLLFSTSVLIGALIQGHMVMKTLGKGIVPRLDLVGAVSASLTATFWVFLASLMGLPVSTSQSATSSVLGVGLAQIHKTGDPRWINLGVVQGIIMSWVLSPLLALLLVIGVYTFFNKLHRSGRLNEKLVTYLATLFVFFSGYSFGANDVANATGVYVAIIGSNIGESYSTIALALYAAIFIAMGGLVMGKYVVETIGYRITRLDSIGALSSSLISAFSTWLFTTIPYALFGFGIPVSTTYITVASVIGVGVAKYGRRKGGLNLKLVALIISSWIFTLPVTALIGMGFYHLLSTMVKA